MDSISDLNELIANLGDQPTGLVVRSAAGKLFFITDEIAKQTAIPANKAYEAYIKASANWKKKPGGPALPRGCTSIKRWLDSHDPDSKTWRRLSIKWANSCL